MTKEQMVNLLWERIETSESLSGDFVLIRKSEAEELAKMLSGDLGVKRTKQGPDGMKLFYCQDCSRSFMAAAREDPECYEKYQYHTWYAKCPWCGGEVSQNDRYWR